MLGDYDIWREILSYLEIDFATLYVNRDDEVLKRRSIFHVALLSRDYVEVGLDALWEKMITLQPIVNILNGNAPLGRESLQQQKDEDGHLRWILCRPIEAGRADLAKQYLSRIKYFHFEKHSATTSLCLALSGILANGAYLLPNLEKFYMSSPASLEPYQYSIFVSPALKHIIYGSSWSSPLSTIAHHLNVLLHSSVDLVSVSHHDHSSHLAHTDNLIDSLIGFKSLQKLDILSNTKYMIDPSTSSYSIDYLLLRLPNLKSLSLDLCLFSERTSVSFSDSFDKSTKVDSLSSLQKLWIRGRIQEINAFIFNFPPTSNNVTILHINCTAGHSDSMNALFNKASSIFPLTKSLRICWPDVCNKDCRYPNLTDLEAFLTHEHLTSFYLWPCEPLAFNDIHSFVTSWPNLEKFELDNKYKYGSHSSFSTDVLINFSTLSHLTYLRLPLKLTTPISENKIMEIARGRAPLDTLTISEIDKPLKKLKEKIALMYYLLRLFPSLRCIKSDSIMSRDLTTDLQELLDSHRAYHDKL